jgi:hypothetical protein
MGENSKHKNFLAYINNPMSIESIMVIYDANNVTFQKCELYGDFVQSLLRIVFDTYMGDDVTDLVGQTKHFKWCWEKNIQSFNYEGFNFQDNKLYDYFLEFMLEVFYTSEKKGLDYMDANTIKLWFDIFDYSKIKTNSEMDTFIEVYKIFENSLKSI